MKSDNANKSSRFKILSTADDVDDDDDDDDDCEDNENDCDDDCFVFISERKPGVMYLRMIFCFCGVDTVETVKVLQ